MPTCRRNLAAPAPQVERQRSAWKKYMQHLTGALERFVWFLILLTCSCISTGPRSSWKEYGNGLGAKVTGIDEGKTNWQLWIGSPTNRKMVTELYAEEGLVWTCMPSILTSSTLLIRHTPSQMAVGGGGQSAMSLSLSSRGLAGGEEKISWEDMPEILRRMAIRDSEPGIRLRLQMPVFMDDIERFCSILGRSGIVGMRLTVELGPDVEWLDPKYDRRRFARPTSRSGTTPQQEPNGRER
jgi:hypothetical protein